MSRSAAAELTLLCFRKQRFTPCGSALAHDSITTSNVGGVLARLSALTP